MHDFSTVRTQLGARGKAEVATSSCCLEHMTTAISHIFSHIPSTHISGQGSCPYCPPSPHKLCHCMTYKANRFCHWCDKGARCSLTHKSVYMCYFYNRDSHNGIYHTLAIYIKVEKVKVSWISDNERAKQHACTIQSGIATKYRKD